MNPAPLAIGLAIIAGILAVQLLAVWWSTRVPEGGREDETEEDEEGEDAVNCPVRWPAETHFSDHVCAISNVWHEGPHRCMRCGEKFNCT